MIREKYIILNAYFRNKKVKLELRFYCKKLEKIIVNKLSPKDVEGRNYKDKKQK